MKSVLAFGLALSLGSAFGADTLSGPVAGYLAGPAQAELRAITGVPGSYLFSEPLSIPDGITRIRIAPGRDFAIVERGENAPAVAALSGPVVDRVMQIDGAIPAADWVAFSVTATAAVFSSNASHRLQIVTGLPDNARVAFDFDTTTLPFPPIAAAVNDDGSLVLAATSQALYSLSAGAAPQMLFSGERLRGIAILPNGKDAVVADGGNGTVYLIAGSAAPRVLASSLEGVEQLYPSADQKTLFASRPAGRAIAAIDIASGQVQSFDLADNQSVAPVELVPLRHRDTFLISARPRQPAWIFYRDGNAGRVAFVPAITRGTPHKK